MKANETKALTLAYLGDAYYELAIRNYMIQTGIVKPFELQKKTISLVSAKAQALIMKKFQETEFLTEKEFAQFKRGRNAKSRSPKNTDPVTYKMSTGFETIIGYLYMNEETERLNIIISKIIELYERGELHG